MGIRTGSILRETSTDRVPSRRRCQRVPEARQPLPPTSAEPLAKIIRVDPHLAMHYPPTLGSPRVPTGRLVLPSTEMPPMGTCSEHSKIITRHREEWNGNRTSQGGTTTTVVLRRKPQTSLGIAVYFRKKTESYFYGEPTSSVGRQPECHDTQRAPMVRRNRSTRGSGPSRRLESGRVEEESTSG